MSKRLAAAIVTLELASCKGCRTDHPYVPYSIVEDAGDSDAAGDDDSGPIDAPAGEVSATQAPAHSTRWTLGGVSVAAPAGQVFELGIARDVDGDGHLDFVALVRRDGQDTDLGTLVLYKWEGEALAAPTTIAESPAFNLAGTADCQPKRKLSAIGHHSVWIELGYQCATRSGKEPLRQVSVWTLRAQPRLHFSAQIADPPGAPQLSIGVEAPDIDGDGLDDVVVHVAIAGGDAPFEPLPKVSATLRWFDRPAGMSRDPDGPDGSLRAMAAGLAVRAAKVKDAPQVLAQARGVRVLWSAICGEGQSPRIVHVLGGPAVACGSSRALEEAGLAEARAHAVLGDALGAIESLEQAQLSPATKTPARTKDAEAWINQVAPTVQATMVRSIAAVPQASRNMTPAWGALAFEPSGKLLVRTAAGVVRVDPDRGDEADASDITPWPLAVSSPDGSERLARVYDPCDGIALHASFGAQGDVDVPLPIDPRLGARCNGKPQLVPVVPLAWGQGGLEMVVKGEPILVAQHRASALRAALGQVTPHGSARSPDGKTFAFPTSLGVLVVGARARILRAPDVDGTYTDLRDCTVSDDATHVACVHAGKAWVAAF